MKNKAEVGGQCPGGADWSRAEGLNAGICKGFIAVASGELGVGGTALHVSGGRTGQST